MHKVIFGIKVGVEVGGRNRLPPSRTIAKGEVAIVLSECNCSFCPFTQYEKIGSEMDTLHVFDLVKYDAILESLTHQEAAKAVTEAFNLLHSVRRPEEKRLTQTGCIVVSIIQQLLIRLFTKRLMNLMSAEALVINRSKIPCSYINNYLTCQAHFSLKDAIEHFHTILEANIK